MKYGNSSSWKKFFYSPASIGIAIVMFGLIVRGGFNIHEKALLAQDRLDQTQAELVNLEHQKQSLSASIEKLSTPAGVEAELREKYHGVREGESVAVIIDPNESGKVSGATTSGTSTPELTWWGKVLRLVGF